MDDVKRPNISGGAPDGPTPTSSDDATSSVVNVASKPISVVDASEPEISESAEPAESPESPEISQAEAAVEAAEVDAPVVKAVEPAPTPAPESGSTSTNPLDSIKQSDPETATQKGAGLDLSSLSNDDAKDLGLPPMTDSNAGSNLSMAKQPKTKGHGPVVVVAILVALALIAGAGYAYYSTNQKKKSVTTTTPAPAANNTTATPQKTEVKAADIDTTTTALDASLKKVDDTKDFAATDLTDVTLGLQ